MVAMETREASCVPCTEDPFQDPVVERALLRAIANGASPQGIRIELFCPVNRAVFIAILDMARGGLPIDAVLLSAFLRDKGSLDAVGGVNGVAELLGTPCHPENIGGYVERLESLFHKRRMRDRLISLGEEARAASDIEELTRRAARLIAEGPIVTQRRPPGLTSAELAERDIPRCPLIHGVLEEHQGCVIGGASKSLKTSIGVEAAASLGSGTPFLHHFKAEQRRVAFFSAESGLGPLKDTLRRVCESKGIRPHDCDIIWEPWVPRVAIAEEMADFRERLERGRIEVVFIDPVYWALACDKTASGAGNVFTMGSLLQEFTRWVPDGCTPLLIHHFTKTASRTGKLTGEPPQLEDLAQAGFAEFARQWLLIGRRTPYDGESGLHELWLQAGGSAGHGGLYGVDVREGRITDIGGRKWAVTVMSREDVEAGKAESIAERSVVKDELRTKAKYDAQVRKVLRFIQERGKVTKTDLHKSGVKYQSAVEIAESLLEDGQITLAQIQKSGRSYPAYERVVPDSGQQ